LYKGLSLDQAPPLAVPFSFYIAGSLMGVGSGVAAGYLPDLTDRWHPLMMLLAHSFLLGFVGLVMFGSIFQMLPVVAGAAVARPVLHSRILLLLLLIGLAGLLAGFVNFNWRGWRSIVVVLAAGLFYFLVIFFGRLLRVRSAAPAVLGMNLAGFSLLWVIALGAAFIAMLSGFRILKVFRPFLTDMHLSWGVAGWIGFLIQGVLCQVVPMFFVTPPFSRTLIRVQMAVLFTALTAKSVLGLLALLDYPVLLMILDWLVYASVFFGAAYSLRLSFQRKRKVRDLSLWLIRFGLGGILAGTALLSLRYSPTSVFAVQVIALFGINSIVLGMLFKIVPFLVWFHLQAQAMDALLKGRNVAVPTMKEIVSDQTIKTQMVFHAAVLLGFLWAFWSDDTSLLSLAGVLSFSFLCRTILSAWRQYRYVSKNIAEDGERLRGSEVVPRH